jgi:hypothetical protein
MRRKSRFGILKFLLLSAAVVSITWIVSIGMVQL